MTERFEPDVESLHEIAERLAEEAMILVSRAIKGDPDSIRIERELQRARRAVLKAAEILENLNHRRDD